MNFLMSKGITQSQWLNIVIIVISGLILAFMLIGRFMNQAVDESHIEQSTQQSLRLTRIDFGGQQIILQPLEKSSQPALKWSVKPVSSLSAKKVEELVSAWQQVLAMPVEPSYQHQQANYSPIATVLLYFAKRAQPLIAKVEVVNHQNHQQPIVISFVSTGQQLVIKDLIVRQLIPAQTLRKRLLKQPVSDETISDKATPEEQH